MRSLAHCEELYKDLSDDTLLRYQSEASARYILYSVKEPNLPNFTQNLDESLNIQAYLYISLGQDFYNHGEIEKGETCFERAGTILEHINRENRQDIYSQYGLLISALSYYCAGQISKAFVVADEIDNNMPIGKMVKLWLHKEFDDLQNQIDSILIEENPEIPIVVKQFASSTSCVISFIQHGDFRLLDSAIKIVHKMSEEASNNGEPDIWIVSSLMEQIYTRLKDTSFWTHVPRLGDNDEVIKSYIHKLYYSHHIFELFKTQIEALEVILRGEGAVISLPTSSGKTRIAELAIMKELMEDPDSAILYLAPFRSLAYEVEEDYESIFDSLGFKVTHLYGSNDFSESDRLAMSESSIWIATPEKAKAIYRCGGFIKRISLVVLDEGHLIDESNRYAANEMFTEELRIRVENNGGHFLLLSAVLPNAADMAKWLARREDNNIVSDWRLSSQRTGVIINKFGSVDIEWDKQKSCFNNKFITENLDWKATCANVAKRIQSFGAVLIFVAKADWVNAQAKAIYDIVCEEDDVDWGNDIDWEKFVLICQENDPKGTILKYAKKGILCHNAHLTDSLRTSMDGLLRKKKVRYVVATNTLAQGVNIGVSSVIFATVDRGHLEFINKRDFWNIAGRAGRAFVDTEGKILFYADARSRWMEKLQRDQAWDYMDHKEISNVKSGVLTIIETLLNKCDANQLSELQVESVFEHDDMTILTPKAAVEIQDKFDVLDDSILSIVISCGTSQQMISQQVDSSLALLQAQLDKKERIRRMLMARYRRNQSYAEHHEYLFYTGMALNDAETILGNVDHIYEILRTYSNSSQTINDLMSAVESIEDIVLSLPSKRITKIDKDILNECRHRWFSGEYIVHNTKRKNIVNFYQFSMSWVLNAISSYFTNVQDNRVIADTIHRINCCSRYGLPSYAACRVFMAGVESRQAAIELSPFVNNFLDERTAIIQHILLNITDIEQFSERTQAWLNIIKKEDNAYNARTTYLNPCHLKASDSNDAILYICKVGENFYSRNADYTFVRKIEPHDYPMEKVANGKGLYFEKINEDLYELVSDNDKYRVVKR